MKIIAAIALIIIVLMGIAFIYFLVTNEHEIIRLRSKLRKGIKIMKLKDIIKLCGSVREVKVKMNDGYGEEELRLISILKNENLYFNIKDATVESLEVQDDVLVILIEEKAYY